VVGPLVAILLVAIGLWGRQGGTADLTLLAGLYLMSCLGVTAGYHRLFTHRSFVAGRALKISLAVAGAVAVEGSLMSWVSNHRRHHRHSDQVAR
jgi:stearoyl-CoA desaturase (delta-9 desaturase)